MLHRFPTGVGGEKVHQKRLPAGAPPWVETVRVHFPRYGRTADELCVTELASVIWAVQMSTVEFHPWNSRRADAEQPDEWRIDLDPMPECRLRAGCGGSPTWSTRCSTSSARSAGRRPRAATGMHVYVRIEPALRLQGRAPRRAGLRPRGRAAGARRGDDDVVAQGPRPDGVLRRLQPERPRPHDRRGLLGARRPEAHGLDPDPLGRGRRRRAAATSRSPPCRRGSPSSATCTPASTTRSSPSTPLLEWADRDERAGAGPPDGWRTTGWWIRFRSPAESMKSGCGSSWRSSPSIPGWTTSRSTGWPSFPRGTTSSKTAPR